MSVTVDGTGLQTVSAIESALVDNEMEDGNEIGPVSGETSCSSRLSSMSATNISPLSPYAANSTVSMGSHRTGNAIDSSAALSISSRRTISQLSNEIIAETPEPPNAYSSLLASSLAAAQPTYSPLAPSQTTPRAESSIPQPSRPTPTPPNQSQSNSLSPGNGYTGSTPSRTCCSRSARNHWFRAVVLVIFCVSTAATVFQWVNNQALPSWRESTCTIDDPELQENQDAPPKYRIVANVTKSRLIKIDQKPVKAYYGTDDSYSLMDKSVAKDAIEKLSKSKENTCWIFEPQTEATPRISLKFVVPDVTTYLVWFTTIVAVCTGLFLFFIVVSRVSDRIYDLTDGPNSTFRNVRNLNQTPSNTAQASNRPRCLTIRQTRFVCNVFAREWLPSQELNDDRCDWICSICLEEADARTQKTIRTVLLPCTHRFHRTCIRHWLRKGKPACPLCQWDARQLFNEDGEPTQFIVDTAATPDDTAPLQCVAFVRDDAAENVLTLHPADHERFTQGVQNWQSLNDDESISSVRTPQPASLRNL